MPNNAQYYNEKKLILTTGNIKGSVITRIKKGHSSVYDITVDDILKSFRKYLIKARVKELPVILIVLNQKRLLIFNRKI